MTDILTGLVRIDDLADFGFSTDLAVALDAEMNVVLVQFNAQGNIQDVWDGVPLGGIGFIPARHSDGVVGPVGVLPPMRIGGGDGPIGVLPPIRIGDGKGPMGVLPRIRIGGGRGPVGTLPPMRLNSENGPIGVLPPVRIGGGTGPVGSDDKASNKKPVTFAVAFSQGRKNRKGNKVTVELSLRQMKEGEDTFKLVGTKKATIMIDQPLITSDRLGAVHSISDFRDAVNAQATLSIPDREVLVDQAIILLRDIYAHLPLKRAMHSIDPVQRLRLLKQRLGEMSTLEFHAELLSIFKELRDLHTNLILPAPFGTQIAFLGILVERFVQNGTPRYLVSKVFDNLVTDGDLEGAEITHWNGMPIDAAVARNADKEAGSNIPSRMARGLETLTLRSLQSSLVPDEDWVRLTYVKDNAVKETQLNWLVFDSPVEIAEAQLSDLGFLQARHDPTAFNLGVDERQEIFRRAKKKLFAPGAIELASKTAADCAAFEGSRKDFDLQFSEGSDVATQRPDEISARLVTGPDGKEYGYLRLWTFLMEDQDIEAFLSEVLFILEDKMPENGLVIDVRGNGGGYIIAAEFLLQFLTWRKITPEPAQFVATSMALDFVNTVPAMEPWRPSLAQALETGALYSKGLPISPPDMVNSIGQVYFGPVVLITDAYCYSACDMFAAGFQDHKIGKVLGVDMQTGAGGANVVTHQSLVEDWHGGPFETLPANAGMRVSLRRTMRVGDQTGDPVEDLGVSPDILHETTRRDLMESNADLLDHAISILQEGEPRRFEVSIGPAGATLAIALDTVGIDSADVYMDGRPVESAPADNDGAILFEIDFPGSDHVIELLGYSQVGKLVAKRKVRIH